MTEIVKVVIDGVVSVAAIFTVAYLCKLIFVNPK